MTFLFCVYTFMRGCSLLDSTIEFEKFVDQMHGKKFKIVRPGSAPDEASLQTNLTSAVTPEVFILQIDLLTSCTAKS